MQSRNDPVPDPLFLVRGKSGRLYVNGRHRHSFNKGVIQSNLYYVRGKLFLAPPNYPFPQGVLMCPIPSGPAKAHTAEAHRFEAYLRSKKLKLTGERMEILAAVFQKNAHFDAEELHAELKHHGRDISRATVYRTLDLLVQCGLVRKSSLGSSHANYEAAHEDEHHDHLICLNCNKVIEFYRPDLERCRRRSARSSSSSPCTTACRFSVSAPIAWTRPTNPSSSTGWPRSTPDQAHP